MDDGNVSENKPPFVYHKNLVMLTEEKRREKPATEEEHKKPFFVKPIPKKKKDCQKKLKHYFPVLDRKEKVATRKKEMAVDSVNFQGFPLDACVFEPAVNKWLYYPPKWGVDPEKDYGKNEGSHHHHFCEDCLMRPCFALEKRIEILGFAESHRLFGNDDDAEMILSKTYSHVEALFVEIFGLKYGRKFGIPICVDELLFSQLPEAESECNDESLLSDQINLDG
jgi:hypothetical protein